MGLSNIEALKIVQNRSETHSGCSLTSVITQIPKSKKSVYLRISNGLEKQIQT